MFRLTSKEFENLRRQLGASSGWGGRRYSPLAFTEQGIAMLSSVLHSARAVQVNIAIMRAFVSLREMVNRNENMAKKLSELENRLSHHDGQILAIVKAIREIAKPKSIPKRRQIGFLKDSDE